MAKQARLIRSSIRSITLRLIGRLPTLMNKRPFQNMGDLRITITMLSRKSTARQLLLWQKLEAEFHQSLLTQFSPVWWLLSMLHISISIYLLRTPNAGWNLIFNVICAKKLKKGRKFKQNWAKKGGFEFDRKHWLRYCFIKISQKNTYPCPRISCCFSSN